MNSIQAGSDAIDLYAFSWSLDEDAPEYEVYRQALTASPGKALDAGCGTGRILRRALAEGFDIEGCDILPAMLEHCRELAAKDGLSPTLYHQSLQSLDLPKQYSLIYVGCGTMMCITDAADIRATIERLWAHLLPGGRVLISLLEPSCKHLIGAPMPTEWEKYHEQTLPCDQGRLDVAWRAIHVDGERQIVDEETRYRLEKDGKVIREQISKDRHHWYNDGELEAMLAKQGFRDVVRKASNQPAQDTIPEYFVEATRPAN